MSDTDAGTQHDEVVTSLLDLQRRLRGDHGAAIGEGASGATDVIAPAPPVLSDEAVAIQEDDLEVEMIPDPVFTNEDERLGFAPVTQLPTSAAEPIADERVAAMNERLGRLEEDLSGVLGTIEEIRSDSTSAVEVEERVIQEVASTRSDLQRSLDEGFQRLQETLARIHGLGAADEGTGTT